MNKKSLLLILSLLSFPSFTQVQLQFTTINQHGNNLYLDNFSIGTQLGYDIGVASINNINPGISYALSVNQFSIGPSVTIINLGTMNVTSPFTVTMTINPGAYSSTKTISFLNKGQSMDVLFDNFTITLGVNLTIVVTLNLAGDQNSANDTFIQSTQYLPGVHRTPLFEEFASSTCSYCAANNPTVDAFINSKFDSLVSIKYHMNWPAPGNDPMYLYDSTQALNRKTYYGVGTTPTIIMDGLVEPPFPYTLPYSLPDAFNSRQPVGTPTKVTVINTRLPGDTIRADVTVQNYSPLQTGSYYLRVCAVERVIRYATAPGKNGEKVFYDVFRAAYPNSQGTSIPSTVGTYNYSFKYHLDMNVWVDSLIYTAAFVQNDATGEVINAGKSRHIASKILYAGSNNNPEFSLNSPVLIHSAASKIFSSTRSVGNFQYELFEGSFPPAGWYNNNPDGDVTFNQYKGANGSCLGGKSSIIVPFYYYSTLNASDTLYSKIYNGLTKYDSVKFDYAYAPYQGSYNDRLIVKLSTDAGVTFPFVIFDKMGTALATTAAISKSFIPTSPSQWVTFSYPLPLNNIPVELNSFVALLNGNSVCLKWNTATEANNMGFEIQRSSDNNKFSKVGFVKGIGSTTTPGSYSFVDKIIFNTNEIYYRLRQIDYNGKFTLSNVVKVTFNIPLEYSLKQNYPNPFNPTAIINYQIPKAGLVTIKVFDILGKEVATLANENKEPGFYNAVFDGSKFSNGVYIYQLHINDYTFTKKMTLIK